METFIMVLALLVGAAVVGVKFAARSFWCYVGSLALVVVLWLAGFWLSVIGVDSGWAGSLEKFALKAVELCMMAAFGGAIVGTIKFVVAVFASWRFVRACEKRMAAHDARLAAKFGSAEYNRAAREYAEADKDVDRWLEIGY